MAALGNLPEELIIEILSKLPPESLLRLKSVQKSWYALINDSKFIRKQLSNSLHHNHILLKRLIINNNTGTKKFMLSILNFDFSIDRSDSFFDNERMYFEFCGHSHGLLCLSNLDRDIILCNPSTREFRKLPPSILHLTEPPQDPHGYRSFTNSIGFGYDRRSKDFKVVRIVQFVEGRRDFYPCRVEIYDLSKDRWREIEISVCGGDLSWQTSFGMFHQGTYYWSGIDRDEVEIIQTFDMTEEVFARISLPKEFEEHLEEDSILGILNGSIVLFRYPLSGNEKTFNVWEMNKDGVSWSKILKIGPFFGIQKPLLFVNSDELLMVAKKGQEKGQVVMYNVRTRKLKHLPIKGHPTQFQPIFFDKSLASVKGGSHIMSNMF